jgi:hypothetical protein
MKQRRSDSSKSKQVAQDLIFMLSGGQNVEIMRAVEKQVRIRTRHTQLDYCIEFKGRTYMTETRNVLSNRLPLSSKVLMVSCMHYAGTAHEIPRYGIVLVVGEEEKCGHAVRHDEKKRTGCLA